MNPLIAVGFVGFAPLSWALIAGFFHVTPLLLKAIFRALGMGFVTFIGLSVVFDGAEALAVSYFTGLPAQIAPYIGLARLDQAASLLLSALSFRLTLNAICGGMTKQLAFGFPRDC